MEAHDISPGCTGKKAYATEALAREYGRKSGLKLRPYECMWCQQWHLTHHKKRPKSRL